MTSRRPGAPDALLRMLGLAARAGAVLPGTERVREAVRAAAVEFVIVAADASDNSQDKLVPLLESRQIAYTVLYKRDDLGAAIGKAPVSAIGITDQMLAKRIKELMREQSDDVAE